MENRSKSMEEKINTGLEKLYKIKEMVNKIIGIPNSDKYSINELKEMYYKKNPDVFKNLISAYNHINEYTDERIIEEGYEQFLNNLIDSKDTKEKKYIYYNELSDRQEYRLVNVILEDFVRGRNVGANHTREFQKATEKDIYVVLDFEQYVSGDIISIKDIKEKWNKYTEVEQEKIKNVVKKKFDTRIWVLKQAVDESISFAESEKDRFEKNNKENSGEDIDI
ncbi:MAG: hypothetical protein E7311_02855 [Clostridiales bacterium]|nr:hypothetical protein [Clostridiales bacterium]